MNTRTAGKIVGVLLAMIVINSVLKLNIPYVSTVISTIVSLINKIPYGEVILMGLASYFLLTKNI